MSERIIVEKGKVDSITPNGGMTAQLTIEGGDGVVHEAEVHAFCPLRQDDEVHFVLKRSEKVSTYSPIGRKIGAGIEMVDSDKCDSCEYSEEASEACGFPCPTRKARLELKSKRRLFG